MHMCQQKQQRRIQQLHNMYSSTVKNKELHVHRQQYTTNYEIFINTHAHTHARTHARTHV